MMSVEQQTELLDLIDRTRKLVVNGEVSGVFLGRVEPSGALEIGYYQVSTPGDLLQAIRVANSSLGLVTQLQHMLTTRVSAISASED